MDLGGERQPLLSQRDDTDARAEARRVTPARPAVIQLALLTFWRSCHPLWFAFIFPTITQFIIDTGVTDQENVGFYAAWIESSYSVAVLLGLGPAALVSDAFGRKKTILFGILCGCIATASFGFAKTFVQMVLIRFLVGFSISFTPATILTSFVELSSKETQPFYFALNSLGWQTGSLVAPFVGAFAARPADRWHYFKGGLFERYPYALPCLIVAGIPALSILLGLKYLKETLPKDARRPLNSHCTCLTRQVAAEANNEVAPPSGMFTRPVSFVLFMWGSVVFMGQAGQITEVLCYSTPIALGGLGLSPTEMAFIFGLRPLLVNAFEIVFYAPLARRYGPEKLLKTCCFGYPLVYLAFFTIVKMADSGLDKRFTMASIAGIAVLSSISNPIYISISQLIPSRVPSKHYLTRANTAAEYVANLGHGLGVLFGSYVWAYSVKLDLLDGKASWLFLAGVAIANCVTASFVTYVPGWRENEEEEDDDADAVPYLSGEVEGLLL